MSEEIAAGINAKIVYNDFNNPEIVLYKTGEYSQPLLIISGSVYMENLIRLLRMAEEIRRRREQK